MNVTTASLATAEGKTSDNDARLLCIVSSLVMQSLMQQPAENAGTMKRRPKDCCFEASRFLELSVSTCSRSRRYRSDECASCFKASNTSLHEVLALTHAVAATVPLTVKQPAALSEGITLLKK